MVSIRDEALVEARARGLTDADVAKATQRPWSQILKPDLMGSAFGISVFLLVYFVAASFFTIYYPSVFKNADGTQFTVTQANGLNQWFWAADIIALIVVGLLSDRFRVRKPFMVIGCLGSMVMLIIFAHQSDPHTSYSTLAFLSVLLSIFLATVFAPWMAGYTESVEAKNPALVATGLALWGWVIRIVVAISFIFLPVVINTVNPIVDNNPYASPPPAGGGSRSTSSSSTTSTRTPSPSPPAHAGPADQDRARTTPCWSRRPAHPTGALIAAADQGRWARSPWPRCCSTRSS